MQSGQKDLCTMIITDNEMFVEPANVLHEPHVIKVNESIILQLVIMLMFTLKDQQTILTF